MKDLEDLNPQQLKAVNHVEGPLLVLAGAGSGKTRIVCYRIVHLLQLGVPSSEIIAVTFTNKAAEEMRQRVQRLAHSSVLTSTFHSLCARILRESIIPLGFTRNFVIFDEEDSEKVLKECLIALNLKDEKGLLKKMRMLISNAKNNLIEPNDPSLDDELLIAVYKLYQAKLKEYNALDFDDLLFLTVKLFRQFPEVLEQYQNRWSFILIDEYQDTNHAQYTIAKLLGDKHNNVFAVGDPDQSIYSWRGANIENILNFERDFPGSKMISLEQNYRSRNTILQAANALINHNSSRYEKNLWSDRGLGEKIGFYISDNELAEADFVAKRLIKHHEEDDIPLTDCVIFYRTNFQSRVFEDALLRRRIPYVIIGGLSFYQRREIKDILSLLRIVLGGSDFISFSRTINLPKRGLGEATLSKLKAFAEEHSLDIFSLCSHVVERKLEFKLSQRQLDGLSEYVSTISTIREMVKNAAPLHEILSETIERSHYLEFLKEDPETSEERKANLEELISKAAEWEEEVADPTLATFLEELSLKSSHDEKKGDQDSVRLMTLHNGKGLEFEVVFLVGMEEDLFPHINSLDDPASLEEERRLCYVGMTRAKEYLYFSASRNRFLWGGLRMMRPSRFLKEIPSEYLQAFHVEYTRPQKEESEYTEDEHPFEPDDTVLHKDFGTGIVRKTYQTSLGLTYDVYFPQANITRTLVAKYA
ncbi:MAG TPA: UvrD-helicase domain-containing protein, partial [Rhabdochlamydiaceae bacterium]|nr:UvrD-helicase domain-containing protein [Rhabdochlamydiaceae bacterium]